MKERIFCSTIATISSFFAVLKKAKKSMITNKEPIPSRIYEVFFFQKIRQIEGGPALLS